MRELGKLASFRLSEIAILSEDFFELAARISEARPDGWFRGVDDSCDLGRRSSGNLEQGQHGTPLRRDAIERRIQARRALTLFERRFGAHVLVGHLGRRVGLQEARPEAIAESQMLEPDAVTHAVGERAERAAALETCTQELFESSLHEIIQIRPWSSQGEHLPVHQEHELSVTDRASRGCRRRLRPSERFDFERMG